MRGVFGAGRRGREELEGGAGKRERSVNHRPQNREGGVAGHRAHPPSVYCIRERAYLSSMAMAQRVTHTPVFRGTAAGFKPVSATFCQVSGAHCTATARTK